MSKFFDMRNTQEFIKVLTTSESAMSKNATIDFQAVMIYKGRLTLKIKSIFLDIVAEFFCECFLNSMKIFTKKCSGFTKKYYLCIIGYYLY